MPKTKQFGVFADRKNITRRVIRSRMAAADIVGRDLVKRGIFAYSTFYERMKNAGDIRLEEIWKMEQAGIRFSDEDLLAMFGRSEQI